MHIMKRAINRMPSFWVVEMPQESSNAFIVDNERLVQLVKTKNHSILQGLGAVEGITSALKSNASFGIRGDAADLSHRRSVFGSNTLERSSICRSFSSILCCLKAFSIPITIACAAGLIIAGTLLYGRETGRKEGAGALVFFSVFFVLSALVELVIDTYFGKVKKSGNFVVLLRNGLKQQVPFSGVLVGDIVYLKSGDKIPADGLFLAGQSPKLDESHLTGDPKIVEIDHSNPFLSAGANLVEGHAKMVVTSVGRNTVCFEKQGSLYHQEITLLQARVRSLAGYLERAKWILAVSFLPISLARYFSGNAKDYDGNREFVEGETTALEVSYAFVENILAAVVAMDTTNFSWAVMVSLANAINNMAAHNVIVRNLSSWEKISLGVATIDVVDENNTLSSNQLQASKFLLAPQFVDSREANSSISPDVLELVQQGITLNTTAIAYRTVRTSRHEFFGNPTERSILSRAALELNIDWEKLNQKCTILKVEASEIQGRRILVEVDNTFPVHRRGRADMILKMCSSFYDASGSLSILNEDMRNLLEGKFQSHSHWGKVQVIAFAHKEVSEQEMINDPDLNEKEDCYSLLGFVTLNERNQDGILKRVREECLNAGVGFNLITSENFVNGAAELRVTESNHGSMDETLAEGRMSGDDDTSVSTGRGGEETTENSSNIDPSDRKPASASIDQIEVAKFCLVEELTGGEVPNSVLPGVLQLLELGNGLNTTEDVVSCDAFSGSPIEKAVISWAILELNLDLEELEKKISIRRSESLNLENQNLGFLMSLEKGALHVRKKGSAENILTMCSSYFGATGEKRVLGDHERLLLEQKLQYLESRKCHWVALVHSQLSQEQHPRENLNLDEIQDCWTLLGILMLDEENGVKDDVGCPADEVLASEATDDDVVLEPSHDVNNFTGDTAVEDKVKVSSEANVLVSMGIEVDGTTRTSHIVILDGKYSSLTLILRWARCILDNIQMFLQFQLTTSITSILDTYISRVSLPGTPRVDNRLFSAWVQLLWVNFGMGLTAAVVFGRQKPQRSNYQLAEGRKRQLVTGYMWRNIIAQVAYQIIVISILQFQGPALFGFSDKEKNTVTFVMPIFLQVFNMINARKIEEKNIFSGIQPSFILVIAILLVVPFLLVEILAHFVRFQFLNWKQLTMCIGIAMASWVVGFAVKLVPVCFAVSPLNKIQGHGA